MKNVIKRSFAVFMTLVMCASMLFGLSFSAQAQTVDYVTSNGYIYNWGTRGENATSLSQNAEAFYTDNSTSLSALLALDGSSTESNVPSSALYQKLQALMTDNHSTITSYDDTRDLFKYTDCQNSGSPSTISSFYSGVAIGPEWDSGSTWNREHVWPNSKGDKAKDGENDIMMLRPASVSENSSRGNKAFGTTTTTEYYNPNDQGKGNYDLRGDVARIILYQYVRWDCTNTGEDYNSTGIFGANGVIESQEVLLAWMEEDPVDTWELGRNDSVESITGTRNVFVDYPELAFDLFNESVPDGYTSPSGGEDVAGSSGSTDGSGDSGDTGNTEDTTPKTEVSATIDFTTTDQRVSQTTEQQVWSNAGLTFTNNKASSSTNVANYSNPVRLYKDSSITLKHTGQLKEIVFTASGASYATALSESIGTVTGATVAIDTEDTKIVTVTFDAPVDSFTITALTAQVRLNSITVTALEAASTYTVTALSSNDAHGTAEASGKYITATPATGYEIDAANPYTVVSGTATVTQSGNTFTVEADADVTVQINFKERAKGTVSYSQHGTVDLTEDVYIGNTTTLPTHIGNVPLGWKFEGWVESDFTGETTTKPEILAVDYTYTVEADVTLYAVYSRSETTESTSQAIKQYVKITSNSELTDGQYLIVYEAGNVAFNGGLTTLDAASNKIDVTINDGIIEATDETDVANFTINTTAGTIQSASGYYIGNTADSNKLNSSTSTEYTNTITFNDDGSAQIVGSGNSVLRYNANSGQYRFRYFKSTTYTNQKAICLYKLTEGTAGGTITVTTNYYFTNGTITDDETQGYYIKVTEDQTDWSGEYLIVYENDGINGVVFDGGRETLDQPHNVIKNVALNGGAIKASESLDAAKFTVVKSGDGYTFQTVDGDFIGSEADANGIVTGTADVHTITFADGVVSISGSTGKVLTFNSTNNKTNYRFRYYTNAQKPIALYKYVPFDADIAGAQVEVGADLSVNFYVSLTNESAIDTNALSMRFTFNEDEPVTVSGTKVDGEYTFTFAGLPPQRMTDNIKAELLLNDAVLDVVSDYSVQQNAINLLADNPSDELKQFITDMLYYGEAAQIYRGHNTGKLATDGVEGIGTASKVLPTTDDAMTLTNETSEIGDVYLRSATVWFDSVNKLIIKLSTVDENTQLYVNDTLVEINYDSETGVYSYTTDGILATEFDTVYTFKLYDNGTLVQTLTYSVNAYAFSKQSNSNENMANLALALYRYGVSAEAYADSLK